MFRQLREDARQTRCQIPLLEKVSYIGLSKPGTGSTDLSRECKTGGETLHGGAGKGDEGANYTE